MDLWQAPEGRCWRCAPCDWEAAEAPYIAEDVWDPSGPSVTWACCPRCGGRLDLTPER